MSTPKTDAAAFSTRDWFLQVVSADFARELETDNAALDEELRQTREILFHDLDRDRDGITTPHLAVVAGNAIAALRQQVADLTAEITEIQSACTCGAARDTKPEDPDPFDKSDDDEPDYDAPKPLTALENHLRNDEHRQ